MDCVTILQRSQHSVKVEKRIYEVNLKDLIDYLPLNDCFISLWIAKHLLDLFKYGIYI